MEGTIWSGRINNLSFADEYLGSLNTSFNLRNLSFLVDENMENYLKKEAPSKEGASY